MKEDQAEMWSMAYIGATLAQTLGRAINGTAFTPGHIDDIDKNARVLADRMVATVAEKAPKKGK